MRNIYLIIIFVFCVSSLFSQTFDVQNYQINLSVPNSYNKNIEGHTVVDVKILQDNISNIDLMLEGLTVDSIKINSTDQTYNHAGIDLNIELGNTYQTNELVAISVYYHGNAHTDADGWGGYLSSGGYAYNLGVSMSSDPHNYGRVWFPCVDNFTDKATYEFNITCQDARTAICGGTLQSEVDNGDGTKTFSWLLDREISTYLASIAVGNYEVYRDTFEGDLGEVPVAIYARSEEIADVPGSFANLEDIFNIFEEKFGAYRWSRVGYVGVPFNSGAMEHAENIAYPNNSINGNLNSESLLGHELAHSWFGNLTTCSTAGDMWINEGWASYLEAIYTEGLYGIEAYKDYNRARHLQNIQRLHFNEGGFLSLYDLPTELTYSSHSYDKGADVAKTLRGHLGDDLFFSTMTNFLNDYQFQSVSSYELRDYITANTPYNLDGFFDSWVFDGGWLHFAVDSFEVTPNGGEYDVEVFMRQKLKGKTVYGQNNRVPIQFLSANFERIDTMITMSGESDSQTFTIPFQPYSVLCDMEEKLCDATTDKYQVVKNTETINFQESYFKTTVSQVTDSVLFRVEHNWAGPDDFATPIEGLDIHTERYWKIDGIFNNDFQANGQFFYTRSASYHLDNEFVTTHVDSIVVLYRPNSGEDWQIVPHTRSGSTSTGYMVVDQIQRGEYAFAIYDQHLGSTEIKNSKHLKVYPNPAKGKITVEYGLINRANSKAKIFDLNGRLLIQKEVDPNVRMDRIDISELAGGTYILKLDRFNQEFLVE